MRRIMYFIEDNLIVILILISLGIGGYTLVGTSGNIEYIKKEAPLHMAEKNWKILRYEGYEYGSWCNSGGKVWYHVANIDNPSIQYRIYITLWRGELQYTYGAPEQLQRIEVNYKKD